MTSNLTQETMDFCSIPISREHEILLNVNKHLEMQV